MDEEIKRSRKSYLTGVLDSVSPGTDPVQMFGQWMNDAIAAGVEEPNGMALATASADAVPAVRVVLLRGFDVRGFTFYTNYESAKGRDLAENPRASAAFWWQPLERQVRIGGRVERVPVEESEAYFHSRPRGHQLAGWASQQSRVIQGRGELDVRAEAAATRFPGEVPLPDFWGGYRLVPDRMEFWQGRENRLHDRFLFERRQGTWSVVRLAP